MGDAKARGRENGETGQFVEPVNTGFEFF
jgi:hypothetical protein